MTTAQIKAAIIEELKARDITPTPRVVASCYHNHMVTDKACPEVDIEDCVNAYCDELGIEA